MKCHVSIVLLSRIYSPATYLLHQIGDENNPSGAVEEILSQPNKLSDLDLDVFAEELERQDYGNKKITLYDIRNELFAPFKEKREAYSPMTEVCTHCGNCVQYCWQNLIILLMNLSACMKGMCVYALKLLITLFERTPKYEQALLFAIILGCCIDVS